jgi:hypothetical protein
MAFCDIRPCTGSSVEALRSVPTAYWFVARWLLLSPEDVVGTFYRNVGNFYWTTEHYIPENRNTCRCLLLWKVGLGHDMYLCERAHETRFNPRTPVFNGDLLFQDDHRAFRRQLEDKRPVVESNLLSGRQYIANEPPLSDTSDSEGRPHCSTPLLCWLHVRRGIRETVRSSGLCSKLT